MDWMLNSFASCAGGGIEVLASDTQVGAEATPAGVSETSIGTEEGEEDPPATEADKLPKPLKIGLLDTDCHQMTSPGTMAGRLIGGVHPRGLEPLTPGSEDRCSIQLSYGCDQFLGSFISKMVAHESAEYGD